MFAEFNYDNFPIVNVRLNNVLDEADFNDFLEKWLKLYLDEKDFVLVFDTLNVSYVPIKYSIRMAEFIKKLKEQPYHYLQKSIIHVNNNIVKVLLNVIFKLQSPVAPVYIIENISQLNQILKDENTDNVICIMPGKSYIPFL
jgi:hypothetical protein